MNTQREIESEQEKSLENERVYRAGAANGCQALRNSWSICPCLQPVCNKKELKGRRGWTSQWGKQQIADASIGEGSL